MQDLIAALVAFFIIEPLQAEIGEKLAAARVPQSVITEVAACAQAAAPVIVKRAINDPLWGITTTLSIWIGSAKPDAMLIDAAPSCAQSVQAARTFLNG
jgi:hypothetical protein